MEKMNKGESISGDEHSYCCISHAFFNSSKLNYQKVAVIQVEKSPSQGHELPRKLMRTNPPLAYEGDRVFTYAEILSAVALLSSRILYANHFLSEQSECNARKYIPKVVGLFMPPSPEYVISVLTVLRIGCAFLPLDPSWSKEKLSFIISAAQPCLLITSGTSYDWISQFCSCDVIRFTVEELIKGEACDGNDMRWPCEMQLKRMFCYLMYTSGSTGRPKGVCGTEQGMINRFLWMHKLYPFSSNEVLLFKTSTSFVDHLQEVFSSFLSGCTLVIPPFNDLKENPLSLVSFLQDYLINRVTVIPSVVRAILPAIKMGPNVRIKNNLNIIVLSGEVFSISLWESLADVLPNSSIINLYGSTEVSGDCTFFDCKRLPEILEEDRISSVPIGVPISNCHVALASASDDPKVGEILVCGICLSCGYFSEGSVVPFDLSVSVNISTKTLYYRTGDLGRQLKSGDLVFLGRNDRMIKVNGQRVALEEVEDVLRSNSNVADVAVVSHGNHNNHTFLEAFVIPKIQNNFSDTEKSIRKWMADRVQFAMVPNRFVCVESLPLTSSGKVNYSLLSSSLIKSEYHERNNASPDNLLQTIKDTLRDALASNEPFDDDDDFFAKGGNSIGAAHASYNLKISIKTLYEFSTPSKLCTALRNKADVIDSKSVEKAVKTDEPVYNNTKRFKADVDSYNSLRNFSPCSFNRGNQMAYGSELSTKTNMSIFKKLNLRKGNCLVNEVYKIPMESCIDASPLLVLKNEELFLFIGSHSRKFLCAYAISGVVKWITTLEGRIECTAAVVDDFSQIVVGCYKGNIYFLDFETGDIIWTFQTLGEVKCQPIIDKTRHLVWCGSHDHNLYALDPKSKRCLYKLACGGSVFASPALDEACEMLFIGSTSGRVAALVLKMNEYEEAAFCIAWQCEMQVPIFSSLLVDSTLDIVICCLVDGNIVALNRMGALVWKTEVGGPVFASPCTSRTLPFQEGGCLLWDYHVEHPISASAYVDEHVQVVTDASLLSGRLICACTSRGRMLFLCLRCSGADRTTSFSVEEYARWDLPGDIFSSPVLVNGRAFVGCRDDFLRCISFAPC